MNDTVQYRMRSYQPNGLLKFHFRVQRRRRLAWPFSGLWGPWRDVDGADAKTPELAEFALKVRLADERQARRLDKSPVEVS